MRIPCHAGTAGAALAAVLLWCAGAGADLIFMRNGEIIRDVEIIAEEGDHYLIRQNGEFRRIPKRDVFVAQRVKKEEPAEKAPTAKPAPPPPAKKTPAPPPAKTGPAEAKTPDTPAAEEKTDEAKKELEDPYKIDGQTKQRLAFLVRRLGSSSQSTRDAARRAIVRIGHPKAVPILVENLTHSRPYIRTHAAHALREIGAKDAAKALIEAMWSASSPTSNTQWWNGDYLRAVHSALESVTGQRVIGAKQSYNPKRSTHDRAMKGWVKWWNDNIESDELPAQYGEHKLDPEAEDFKEKRTQLRQLNLRYRSYPRPKGTF